MDAYKSLYYLLIIPLLSSTASADCPISFCGLKSFNIRFPFQLNDEQQDNCGFPGFNLSCVSPTTLLIHLASSGNFAVRSIDYLSQAIQIYDPKNCLPASLVNFDLSSSPFSVSYFQNYTLLSCPSNNLRFSGFKPIVCLSDSSFSTLATASENVVRSLTSIQTGCVITRHLMVPMVDRLDQRELTSQLENITLKWHTPDCKTCELVGESCGYADSTKKTIKKCYYNNRGGDEGSNVMKYLAFSIAILAMAASIAMACFMCKKDRRDELMSIQRTNVFNTNVVTPDGMITQSTIVGLDQATIESYTKVILGESKRLPGLDDAACPICLSEYHVKENVRCIPECRHCFHAECIDEWLKMNGTCPVCRNSPS
ncbi:RING/U-box superfamily protein [Artemisia annua]|uniref:RING-type E3 ubiquitin transferase n=1 Tax=Artemisia annua TaxID=35608 RepID=A0A2U1L556_ARTAN|nr:RING/U-box superfamily protein [Artemisia annua]